MTSRRRLGTKLRAGCATISTVAAILSAERPAATQMAFRHPGILVNQAQLDFIAAQVNAGNDPWASAFAKASSSSYGSLAYTPKPWATVECGPSSNPNFGCSDERNDALAAYTHALLWYITRNDVYAQNSIAIMNAWSSTLTGGHINSNAPLQAGWTGSVWAEAAEIIRYTYSGWSTDDVASFQNMLATQYVPNLINGAPCKNGNWELIITEALMHISVFNENQSWFDKSVSLWRGRVPAYMYLSSDGPTPVPPPRCSTSVYTYWHQTQFVEGLAQETSRDFGHTFWGLAASVNAAETAFLQGINLYSENADRIMAAFEFHDYINNGGSAPPGINIGPTGGNGATMEIAYNHFVNRLGNSMPETAAQIDLKRPTGANYFLAWETLTHALVGTVGLDPGPTDGATEYFPSYNVQNRTSRPLDEVYGTFIDPADDTVTTWTSVCSGEQRTELRWQNWPNQELTNIEDYDMMFDSDTEHTAVSQVKSNTGGEPIYLQVTASGSIRNDNESHNLADRIDGQWHHWTILFNPSTGYGEIWYDYELIETVQRATNSRDWYFKNGTYNNGLPEGHCSNAYFKNFKHSYQ